MSNSKDGTNLGWFFKENGYCTFALPDVDPVFRIRAALLTKLREITGEPAITLEMYHQFIASDAQHTEIQVALTEFIRSSNVMAEVVSSNLELFEQLVGANIDIQQKPYLRIVRPGQEKDNLGYHRDTFYGGSPYELSVFVPFVNLNELNALRVEAGSHVKREVDIPLIQTQSQDVQKGSDKHSIGFLYAPKMVDPAYPLNMVPVPLSIGEVLIFSLATFHGTAGNESNITRWSVDTRVVDAHAPGIKARASYYRPLASSPSTTVAQAYQHANSQAGEATPPAASTPSSEPGKTAEAQRWDQVKDRLGKERVTFGPYFSYQLKHTPRHILYSLSYHKFAAKMIGVNKEILDVGCSEGLGTLLLAEQARRVHAIDIDEEAITFAQENFTSDALSFHTADMLIDTFPGPFDAVVSFDVIEHIFPDNARRFFEKTTEALKPEGLTIVGTPNKTADQYASATTRSGHVNLYTAERLQAELAEWFENVFMFSVNDEVIHTGFSPMAHYLLAMGVTPKR